MIDHLRNLFISWFNKLRNWFLNWGAKNSSLEPAVINVDLKTQFLSNTARQIRNSEDKEEGFYPRSTEKLLNNEERQKRISEGFQALDDGCKSIANLRAEIEMSQTESKTFKDNEPKVSNDLGAPVPANQIKDTNLNGALAPRRDAMASNNNLEENNMCMGGSKPKKEGPKLNVNNRRQKPNDINDSFEYPNVNKKAFNAMGTKVNGLIDKKLNDNNKQYDQKFQEFESRLAKSEDDINKLKEDAKEMKKDIEDIQEEQIDLKKMLAEMKLNNQKQDEQIADNKRRLDKMDETLAELKEMNKDNKRLLAKMDEDRKIEAEKWREHDAKWMKLFGPYLKKKPESNRNEDRESTNTSFSSFNNYKNRNNSRIPRMGQPDMAHSHDKN